MRYESFTVVIPTLNEGKNIYPLMETIDKLYPGISLIVSDDGSRDETQRLVTKYNHKNSRFRLLDRSKKQVKGLTASVVDGVKLAKTRFFIVIDGDFQHPPEMIEEIASKLDSGYDVVVGTRRKDLTTKWNPFRRLMSKTAIVLGRFRLLLKGIKCRDVVSGFFGCRRNLFLQVFSSHSRKFELTGYKVLFDFLKYVRPTIRITEALYYFNLRERGQSKINRKHIISYFRSLFT
jgi:dolichol-phosphate mannosyltransferase